MPVHNIKKPPKSRTVGDCRQGVIRHEGTPLGMNLGTLQLQFDTKWPVYNVGLKGLRGLSRIRM